MPSQTRILSFLFREEDTPNLEPISKCWQPKLFFPVYIMLCFRSTWEVKLQWLLNTLLFAFYTLSAQVGNKRSWKLYQFAIRFMFYSNVQRFSVISFKTRSCRRNVGKMLGNYFSYLAFEAVADGVIAVDFLSNPCQSRQHTVPPVAQTLVEKAT